MRLRLFIAAMLCALALPAANAAGLSGYCARPDVASVERIGPRTPEIGPRVNADDPLLSVVPVVQYACSNSCRRGCYRASQSCRASRRTCQRQLSACIRGCGC